jgi:hypothetical protein
MHALMGLAVGSPLLLGAGCAANRSAAWEAKEPLTSAPGAVAPAAGQAAKDPAAKAPPASPADAIRQGNEHFAKRADRKELEAAIASWEAAVNAGAGDLDTFTNLARAHYLLADGWLSFEGDAKRDLYLQTHEHGLSYAERGLVLAIPEFARRVKAGEKAENAVDAVGKEGIAALYWYAANLGKWSNAEGFATILKNKYGYQKVMERVLALDENWFYGAPHRALGAMFAKAPPMAGGDLVKAKQHFDRALQIAPGYQGTRVLWAEFYATKAEDRDGYKRELSHVLSVADDVIPELVAETQLAKRQAKQLLEQIEEKFP